MQNNVKVHTLQSIAEENNKERKSLWLQTAALSTLTVAIIPIGSAVHNLFPEALFNLTGTGLRGTEWVHSVYVSSIVVGLLGGAVLSCAQHLCRAWRQNNKVRTALQTLATQIQELQEAKLEAEYRIQACRQAAEKRFATGVTEAEQLMLKARVDTTLKLAESIVEKARQSSKPL